MNLFGALDAVEIKEIPDDGTHAMTLTNWKTFTSQSGNNWLVFQFRMTENETFPHFQVEKRVQYYPELTEEMMKDPKVRQTVNRMKDFLRSLGIKDEEMNNVDLNDYTGLEGYGYGYGADKFNAPGREWKLHNFRIA